MAKIAPATEFINNIPVPLRERPQWVLWREEPRNPGEKPTKVPYTTTGRRASSTDPATWSSFDDVWAVFRRGGYSGIGFVFTAEDEFCGIDLDKSLDEDGHLLPWAAEIIAKLDSYTERSPSGRGVKIWIVGKLPARVTHTVKYGTGQVELYDDKRFFTVTGARWPTTRATIESRQSALEWLVDLLRSAKAKPRRTAPIREFNDDVRTAIEAIEHLSAARADEYNLWLAVGMAAYTVSPGPEMLAEWDRFSRRSSKYQEGEPARKWQTFNGGPSQIGELIAWAKQDSGWRPSARTARDGGGATPDDLAEETWPDPLPLPAGLPPVPAFDYGLLPTPFQAWVTDIAERMQCPVDYLAVTAMVAAATLIGRKVVIRPKRQDDWQVVVNLFGICVGRPSLMKSPAIQEALNFLTRLEIEAKKQFLESLAEHAEAKVVADATKKVRNEELKKAIKKGHDTSELAAELTKEDGSGPTRQRYLVNNTTVEKLGEILNQNPNGVLIYCDEVIGWLKTLDRDGHESDRSFYLTAWSGDKRYTYDRIGRGTVDIEAAIVSFIGAIQPGVLQDYLRQAVHGGSGDDGLVQRFQLAAWPDAPAQWRNVDRWPDSEARARAYEAFQRRADLTPGAVEAERDNYDRNALPFLRFDPEAQEAFDTWRCDLENRLRSGADHPAVEAHLAKYRSLLPSLALIIHLVEGGTGPVGGMAIEKAIGWARYLEQHARRLYAGVTEASAVAARELARRILSGEVEDGFLAREVYRKGWTGLDRDQTQSAIDVLLSLNWLYERVEETAGRPKTCHIMNPKLRNPQKDALTELTQGASVSSVSCLSEAMAEIEVEI